jgi:hypothetical protein
VESRQELDDGGSPLGRLVLAEVARQAFGEREDGHRVALVDPPNRGPIRCGDRSEDELEPGVAECHRGAERPSHALEGGVATGAEPGLPVEVVDGDEASRAARV